MSLESINDIETIMSKNKNLKKFRKHFYVPAVFMIAVEIASILLWVLKGYWLIFILGLITVLVTGVILTVIYYKRVAYICPECGKVFKPNFWSFFFAGHTPRTRKLKCLHCGKKNYCVETYSD